MSRQTKSGRLAPQGTCEGIQEEGTGGTRHTEDWPSTAVATMQAHRKHSCPNCHHSPQDQLHKADVVTGCTADTKTNI